MYIQTDAKTYINSERVDAIVFGASYAVVYTSGTQFRVSNPEAVDTLRRMAQSRFRIPIEETTDEQGGTHTVYEVDPEIQQQIDDVSSKRRKK